MSQNVIEKIPEKKSEKMTQKRIVPWWSYFEPYPSHHKNFSMHPFPNPLP